MREMPWLLALMVLSGCSSPAGYYATNRLDDLTDVAHVDFHVGHTGALANVGPAMLGWELGGGHAFRVGPGGANQTETEALLYDVAAGVVFPFSQHAEEKRSLYRAVSRPTHYANRAPAWGSLGLNVGFAYGLGARVDVVELADFILGLFAVDILGDDVIPEQGEDAAATAPGG